MKTTTKTTTNSPTRPNPLPVFHENDDEAAESEPCRRFACRHYERCLNAAIRADWCGFSCASCPAYEPHDHDSERFQRLCMLALLADHLHGPGTADAALRSLSYDHVFPYTFIDDPVVEAFRSQLDQRASWFCGADFAAHARAERAKAAKARRDREARRAEARREPCFCDESRQAETGAETASEEGVIDQLLHRAIAQAVGL